MKPARLGHFLLLTLMLCAVGVTTASAAATDPFDYAIVHYNRTAGDYGDQTTGDFNDFWGLHLWGDAIDPAEATEWTAPKPFLAEDDFGRFAWIRRSDSGSQVNFILHRGDVKDGTDSDRFFDADASPEIWLNGGDAAVYTCQADAQGSITVRYHRDDGDYGVPGPDYNNFWGLHLWGDAIDPAENTAWQNPKVPTGVDAYGAFWTVLIIDSSQPVNFIIHRGDLKDPGPDESFVPRQIATVWKQSGDPVIYPSRAAAENQAVLHYHRDNGDYGDATSPDFNDFWGLHVWDGALNPTVWTDPVRWDRLDTFGPVYEVDLTGGAPLLAYILHRGDLKDVDADQSLVFEDYGYEVWLLAGAEPGRPYVYPLRVAADTDGDGVVDACDVCPGTSIPESSVPSVQLGKNRYALVDGDSEFDTNRPGKAPTRSYDIAETGGCSCEQIIAAMGLGAGQSRFGCSAGAMKDWIAFIAADASGDASAAVTQVGASGTARLVTGVEDQQPAGVRLLGASPNPVRAGTRIVFDLPGRAEASLDVFDVTGRLVRTLSRSTLPAGRHEIEWNGIDDSGRRVPTGMYVYRLRAGGFESTGRLLVIR